VALVEAALPAGIGLTAKFPKQKLALEFRLFAEDASRVVVSCDPTHLARIQQVAEEFDVIAEVLGETGSDRVEILAGDEPVISASIEELRGAYEGSLEKALRADPAMVARN
jgi:phosphoribosylformylglycinamidine synthase subunit PurL